MFLLLIAVAAAGGGVAWQRSGPGDRMGDLGVFVLVLGGWMVSVCLHEFAHAYTAYRAGDRSVEAAGYLRLNPLTYAHPVLSVLLPLLFIIQGGIGLPGGAVYLHKHAFGSRWLQSAAALIGPLTNMALAAALLASARYLGDDTHARFWAGLTFLGLLQVTAAILNLLPVPGLDGWAVIEPYLPAHITHSAERIKPLGMIGVIVLLQFRQLNRLFFDFVYWLYDGAGISRLAAAYGREYFKFWTKSPL